LRLTADRDPVESGQPVRYTLEIRNRTSINLANFVVQNELPPRFGYLPGSSTRDGRAIADPTGSRFQQFSLDTLAAFTDLNGDGQAGPGEPGYLVLSWVLVPGASATPGAYLDAAVAFAGCSMCGASDRAEATVHVAEDAFLARGTIVGRVFEDSNRDGLQGRDERGLPGATVILDDGTSVSTDADGRFHVPDLDPGPHVVKLDLERLGLPAIATTETSPIAYVSPGLLSTLRFGVSFQRDSVEIGRPAVSGLAIVTDEIDRSASVAGNVRRLRARGERHVLPSRLGSRRPRSPGRGALVDEGTGSAAASVPLGRDRVGVVEARGGQRLRVSAAGHLRGRPGNPRPPPRLRCRSRHLDRHDHDRGLLRGRPRRAHPAGAAGPGGVGEGAPAFSIGTGRRGGAYRLDRLRGRECCSFAGSRGSGRPVPGRARADSPLEAGRACLRANASRREQRDARGPRAQPAR
ncbi:MAG: hypothetical protein E6K75_10180, partial [Candidatus Eisenbacteria bacterium]